MNFQDVLFLDIYQSIRGDWSISVDDRANYMLKMLPETTLTGDQKNWFENHLKNLLVQWQKHINSRNELIWIYRDGTKSEYYREGAIPNPDRADFDGREWARDSNPWNYDALMESPWFDKGFYEKYSIYHNCGIFVI